MLAFAPVAFLLPLATGFTKHTRRWRWSCFIARKKQQQLGLRFWSGVFKEIYEIWNIFRRSNSWRSFADEGVGGNFWICFVLILFHGANPSTRARTFASGCVHDCQGRVWWNRKSLLSHDGWVHQLPQWVKIKGRRTQSGVLSSPSPLDLVSVVKHP